MEILQGRAACGGCGQDGVQRLGLHRDGRFDGLNAYGRIGFRPERPGQDAQGIAQWREVLSCDITVWDAVLEPLQLFLLFKRGGLRGGQKPDDVFLVGQAVVRADSVCDDVPSCNDVFFLVVPGWRRA